jgi:hypothetical protein
MYFDSLQAHNGCSRLFNSVILESSPPPLVIVEECGTKGSEASMGGSWPLLDAVAPPQMVETEREQAEDEWVIVDEKESGGAISSWKEVLTSSVAWTLSGPFVDKDWVKVRQVSSPPKQREVKGEEGGVVGVVQAEEVDEKVWDANPKSEGTRNRRNQGKLSGKQARKREKRLAAKTRAA